MNKIQKVENTDLAFYDEALASIVKAETLADLSIIANKAEAIRAYLAKANTELILQNKAAEIKIRAEREGGKRLTAIERKTGRRNDLTLLHDTKELGFVKVVKQSGLEITQAYRWQNEASVPEKMFVVHVKKLNKAKRELTTNSVLRLVVKPKAKTLKPPPGLYEVIVIDPPWPYGTLPQEKTRRAASQYKEMTLEEIVAIPIPAAPDCILWLWTTHKFMRHCFDLLDNWGFKEKSILTWAKNRIGLGTWLRSKSEFCIMAAKGKPKVNLTNQSTILMADTREHSRKPEEFYEMVDSLCIGRKLDYFARKERKGWAICGDEIGKF